LYSRDDWLDQPDQLPNSEADVNSNKIKMKQSQQDQRQRLGLVILNQCDVIDTGYVVGVAD